MLLDKELARGENVGFCPDCVGAEAEEMAGKLEKGQTLLLENLRFHAEEEANDEQFSKQLARLADFYVNDAFGTAHRAHASTVGMTKFMHKSAAGLLMEKELEYLGGPCTIRRSRSWRSSAAPRSSDKIPVITQPDEQGGFAHHRRRHGLHVPEGLGRAGRQVAGRGRQA